MLKLRNESRLIAILLFCLLGSPHDVVAQAPRTLVLVTDSSDAEYVRRIGGKIVEVEVLLAKRRVEGSVDECTDYGKCNARVKRFRAFRHLFYRENTEGSTDGFWQHRLTAANPKGETHRLPSTRLNTERELSAERAKVIHKALSKAFPNHRQHLDKNLRAELVRLYSVPTLQFALLTD